MEPELWAENGGMRELDDTLLIDFRPHLQAQILRAANRLHECRMVIRSQFAMNPLSMVVEFSQSRFILCSELPVVVGL